MQCAEDVAKLNRLLCYFVNMPCYIELGSQLQLVAILLLALCKHNKNFGSLDGPQNGK